MVYVRAGFWDLAKTRKKVWKENKKIKNIQCISNLGNFQLWVKAYDVLANVLRLFVDGIHVHLENVLKLLSGLDIFVNVRDTESTLGQQRGHVLDVVGRADREALEFVAQVMTDTEKNRTLFATSILNW